MSKSNNIISTLKQRWNLKTGKQVILVLIVFACTGFSVLYAENLIRDLLSIPKELSWYYNIMLFIVITLPVYNILLLIYGFIFGQFKFFWNFEKKFFGRILRLFHRKRIC